MNLPFMAGFKPKYNDLYQKYKSTILFNKNLILSGIAAFFAGAIFSQMYAEQELANNNNRYINPITGHKDFVQIKIDIMKLFAAFSISELIYSVCKISA